jgi:hypothetical protein
MTRHRTTATIAASAIPDVTGVPVMIAGSAKTGSANTVAVESNDDAVMADAAVGTSTPARVSIRN